MNDEYKKYIEQHSADPTQAGFDFQFFSFLYLLLKVDKNESIEYETDDDIVFVTKDGIRKLIQAKNAIQTPAGNWQNLTELDVDLWKTIDNWMNQNELIKDFDFFKTREFKIVTNKNLSKNNFLSCVIRFQNDECEIDSINKKLCELKNSTKNELIITSLTKLISLSEKEKKQFFKRFFVEQFVDIIQEIKDYLKFIMKIPENRINDVFAGLIMEFKISYFHDTCKRTKTKQSHDILYKKVKLIINPIFDRTLKIDRSTDYELPSDILSHIFIKQLIDIDYIDTSDRKLIREAHIRRIEAVNKLSEEQINYNINQTLLDKIYKEAYNFWEVEHDSLSINIRRNIRKGIPVNELEYQDCGINCLQSIRRKVIEPMDQEMTNGYFYDLSNTPKIGWRYDWETKYLKKCSCEKHI